MPIAKKLSASIGLTVCAVRFATTRINAATSYTVVDLGPYSAAYAASDGQQVGSLQSNAYQPNAVVWSGLAQSLVNLNPAQGNFQYTQATGVPGGQQVGYGGYGQRGSIGVFTSRALLWSGSAASAVDLTPNGYEYSEVLGISDGQEVGSARRVDSPSQL